MRSTWAFALFSAFTFTIFAHGLAFSSAFAPSAHFHTQTTLNRQNVCRTQRLGLSTATMKGDGMFSKLRHQSKGLAVGLALAFGIVAPRKAEAAYTVAADGSFTQSAPAPNFAAMGLSAGVAAATFAGGCAVAIKKERKTFVDDVDRIGAEIKRLDSFKQEFLDGVPSDGSLLDSLNKAMKGGAAKIEEEEEDEFEKNVRAFLEEEEKKEDKNKAGNGKAPSTLLERPSDIDGSEVDAWMNDVVFEDKPAEIDAEQLQRLQRMFGGGGDAPAGK